MTLTHNNLAPAAAGQAAAPPPNGPVAYDASTIARRAAGGAFWVLVAFAVARALNFATNLVLARMLSPDAFGLVSFAMILIGAFGILQDLGVPAALIYGGREIRVVANTALTINVVAALFLLGIAALAAPLLATLGHNEQIGPIVIVLALCLVLTALGSVQNALLVREMAFRRKVIPDLVPSVVFAGVSILLAVLGLGAWSLVWGYVARNLTSTLILWGMSAVRPRPGFDRGVAGELLRYGRHVSLASIVGFASANLDYFIVGNRLGAHELGIYTLAFVVASLPTTAISQVVSQVTFPAYSRLRGDPPAVVELFSTVIALIGTLAVPLGVAIFVCTPAYAPLILGPKWLEIVEPLRILIAFGVLRSIVFAFAPAYRAIGRPDVAWQLDLLRPVLLVPLLLLAAGRGIAAIAVVQVGVAALFLPLHGGVLARLMQQRVWYLGQLLLPHLLGAAALAALLAGAYLLPASAGVVQEPMGAAALTLIATALYGGLVLALDRRVRALLLVAARRARGIVTHRRVRE